MTLARTRSNVFPPQAPGTVVLVKRLYSLRHSSMIAREKANSRRLCKRQAVSMKACASWTGSMLSAAGYLGYGSIACSLRQAGPYFGSHLGDYGVTLSRLQLLRNPPAWVPSLLLSSRTDIMGRPGITKRVCGQGDFADAIANGHLGQHHHLSCS